MFVENDGWYTVCPGTDHVRWGWTGMLSCYYSRNSKNIFSYPLLFAHIHITGFLFCFSAFSSYDMPKQIWIWWFLVEFDGVICWWFFAMQYSFRKAWTIGWLDQRVTLGRGVTSMSGIWLERLQKSIRCVRLENNLFFGNIVSHEGLYSYSSKIIDSYVWFSLLVLF